MTSPPLTRRAASTAHQSIRLLLCSGLACVLWSVRGIALRCWFISHTTPFPYDSHAAPLVCRAAPIDRRSVEVALREGAQKQSKQSGTCYGSRRLLGGGRANGCRTMAAPALPLTPKDEEQQEREKAAADSHGL